MARGFVSGALLGSVVCGAGLALVSVLSGPVMAPQPAPDVQEPLAAAPAAPAPDAPPSTTPEAPSRPAIGMEATSPGVPDEPQTAAAPGVQTAPAPVPDAVASIAEPNAPYAPEDAAQIAALPEEETPILPNPQALQPEVPVSEELSITTGPAQPPAPPPVPAAPSIAVEAVGSSADTPVPEEVADLSVAVEADAVADATAAPQGMLEEAASDTEAQAAQMDQVDTTDAMGAEAPGDGATAPSLTDLDPETRETADAASRVEDATEDRMFSEDPAPGPTPDGTAPQIVIAEAPAVPRLPQITEDTPTADTGIVAPRLGAGASDLSEMAPDIATDRLPNALGGADVSEASPSETAALSATPRQGPLETFAALTERAPDRPLMSIVLIDDGTMPLGLEALESFPYPLTFAVPTTSEGARDKMERYRAAGFEVMALADVPEVATPSDVEVSLRAALDAVPEAVAVLEGMDTGLQSRREISDQVARVLADTGHGLVLYPQGLNTAVSLARREGVPTEALFRDFDAEGQAPRVIRRFLDQAAFKARQEGAVIMLGRLRADTISALLLWGLQDRASRVSLVPVSQVLQRSPAG